MSENKGTVHDPRVLRAVAHPVRNRILTELSASGPMRAADVAQELGIPANQASFHLRQLAKYGLVEEAPDTAVRLTKDEAAQLAAEVAELVQQWTERHRGRDDGRTTYAFHAMLLPQPDASE